MAGINAVSATKTHNNSGADVATTGFVFKEEISLTASPAASTSYLWSLSAPSDSSPARSALDDETDANPRFTPDVAGFYTVSVLIDGTTTYVLRIAVVNTATVRTGEVFHLLPLTNAQVATPTTGVALYYSTDAGKAVVKDTSGTVTALY